jgi:hypothetical protein
MRFVFTQKVKVLFFTQKVKVTLNDDDCRTLITDGLRAAYPTMTQEEVDKVLLACEAAYDLVAGYIQSTKPGDSEALTGLGEFVAGVLSTEVSHDKLA